MDTNQVLLKGTIGAAPYVSEKRVSLRLVTKIEYNGKSYDTWHNVVAFKTAANDLRNAKKGDRLKLIGSISYNSYEKDGEKRYITEIVASKVELSASQPVQPSQTIDGLDSLPF